MIKIAHFADIHISNNIDRLNEQKSQFDKVYNKLDFIKPDIIILCGDTLDKHIMINEAKVVASEFLKRLSYFTNQIIITLGNHEVNRNNLKRTSSIESLVKVINNPKIIFLKESGFIDDNKFNKLTYCNWNFGDYVNPYVDFVDDYNKVIANGNFIIDLHHDPINSSKNSFGRVFNDDSYLNLNDFKGDLLLLGDIHQRQFFYNNKGDIKGAYPSSLFQLNHGESQDKHGFILWDINTKTKEINFEEVDIDDNDYSYINLFIENGFDYNDMNLIIQNPTSKMRVRVIWNDYKANQTNTNKRLIEDFLNKKYSNKIVSIRFDKNAINEKSTSNASDDELSNINDKTVQKSILIDYLKNTLGYDDNFVQDILKMDQYVETKLDQVDYINKYDWELESFYLDNFRSHGDRFEIDWKEKDGIWKLNGLNEHGKTNFWSSICYLIYGVTIETQKKQKYGDNRFINNKRDLDYCEAGGVIRINEDRFSIVRRTERKWNRNHTELTACPTTFTINKINPDGSISNENEHEKHLTIKKFEESVGKFDDFLRLSVITGDTLNGILSLDESVFIDSILRDAGLDVYEKKLNIYKEIKKQTYKKEEKIVLDVNKTQLEIDDLYIEIVNLENDVINTQKDIETKQTRIKKGTDLKEDEIKKLHKLDEKLSSLNVDSIKDDVNKLVLDKGVKEDEIKVLSDKIKLLKSDYNKTEYDNLNLKKEEFNKWLIDTNKEIRNKEHNIDDIKNKISFINGEVVLINKEINNINNQIKQEHEFAEKEIKSIWLEIDTFENSKVCPSCKREFNNETIKPIELKIIELKDKIKNIEAGETIKIKIDELYTNIKNKELLIEEKERSKIDLTENIKSIESEILTLKDDISKKTLETDLVTDQIKNIDNVIKEIELRGKLEVEKNNIPNLIEIIDLKIQNHKRTIIDYENNLIHIEENNKIQEKINNFENLLNQLRTGLNDLNNYLNKLNNIEILGKVNKIETLKVNIDKFIEQERKELLNKVYVDCLSRDGIPRLLLLKMRDKINDELSNLLQNVLFDVYFDENLSLKMYDKIKPEAQINAIEGCGKQRTFISLVLRLALREINNKSKNNMLLLDEVCDKLTGDSIQEFFDLLDIIKLKIDKILIIEHAYGDEFISDYNITVEKDRFGVSKMIL